MTDTIVVLDKELEVKPKKQTKRPRDVQILLSVCGCFKNETINFYPSQKEQIAKIFRISTLDLEEYAIRAKMTGTPQIVGCYPPEIAETIMINLRANTPFISNSCHRFFIQKM